MGLIWEGDGPKRRWREGESGGRKGEGERGGREIGGRGGKWEKCCLAAVGSLCRRPLQSHKEDLVFLMKQSEQQPASNPPGRDRTRDMGTYNDPSPALPLSYWWLAIFGEKYTSKDYNSQASVFM